MFSCFLKRCDVIICYFCSNGVLQRNPNNYEKLNRQSTDVFTFLANTDYLHSAGGNNSEIQYFTTIDYKMSLWLFIAFT